MSASWLDAPPVASCAAGDRPSARPSLQQQVAHRRRRRPARRAGSARGAAAAADIPLSSAFPAGFRGLAAARGRSVPGAIADTRGPAPPRQWEPELQTITRGPLPCRGASPGNRILGGGGSGARAEHGRLVTMVLPRTARWVPAGHPARSVRSAQTPSGRIASPPAACRSTASEPARRGRPPASRHRSGAPRCRLECAADRGEPRNVRGGPGPISTESCLTFDVLGSCRVHLQHRPFLDTRRSRRRGFPTTRRCARCCGDPGATSAPGRSGRGGYRSIPSARQALAMPPARPVEQADVVAMRAGAGDRASARQAPPPGSVCRTSPGRTITSAEVFRPTAIPSSCRRSPDTPTGGPVAGDRPRRRPRPTSSPRAHRQRAALRTALEWATFTEDAEHALTEIAQHERAAQPMQAAGPTARRGPSGARAEAQPERAIPLARHDRARRASPAGRVPADRRARAPPLALRERATSAPVGRRSPHAGTRGG